MRSETSELELDQGVGISKDESMIGTRRPHAAPSCPCLDLISHSGVSNAEHEQADSVD
jgi:hypothetical protein